MKVSIAFGRVLKQARMEKELSQEALALNTGYDRTFISLLERGHRQPSIKTVFDLSTELELNASELIRRVERMVRRSGPRS